MPKPWRDIEGRATRKAIRSDAREMQRQMKSYIDNQGFVDRGDPSGFDWTLATLITDGNVYDLDCSSIVPANATAILFHLSLLDDAVGSFFLIKKNGNSNTDVRGLLRTQVANVRTDADIICACDANRVVEYLASSVTFTNIELIVKGWWING